MACLGLRLRFSQALNTSCSTSCGYPATIDAIYSQTDDGIFFSRLLCQDLARHGQALAAQFDKSHKKRNIIINEPDFSKAEKAGLMPPAENYSDWTKMFVEKSVKAQEENLK
jgi:hypothetical protein